MLCVDVSMMFLKLTHSFNHDILIVNSLLFSSCPVECHFAYSAFEHLVFKHFSLLLNVIHLLKALEHLVEDIDSDSLCK